MFRLVIILCEPLANFPGDYSHNWVGIEIMVGLAAQRLNPNRPLLQFVMLSINGLVHYIAKELGISAAMAKMWTGLNPLQLLFDCVRRDGRHSLNLSGLENSRIADRPVETFTIGKNSIILRTLLATHRRTLNVGIKRYHQSAHNHQSTHIRATPVDRLPPILSHPRLAEFSATKILLS
jgi:hypothetical protein